MEPAIPVRRPGSIFLASGCSRYRLLSCWPVFKLGPLGAFIAIPVAETVLALVAYYYFRKGKWKQVAV